MFRAIVTSLSGAQKEFPLQDELEVEVFFEGVRTFYPKDRVVVEIL